MPEVEQYRAFIANSAEAIWRFETGQPIPITLPVEAQIDAFYAHAYLAECNDACARMYGFTSGSELVGAPLSDFLPRDIPENIAYLTAFIASGYRLTDVESVEQDKHGATKHFANSLVGFVEAGMLLRAWGTQRDITAQRHLEQALSERDAEQARLIAQLQAATVRQQASLQESEERFRLLIENVQDYAIFLLDPEGYVATWNAGAERFKGYRASEIIGQHFSRFYTPEDIARRHPWNELEIAKREGRYEEEGWRVRKDGTHFWANVVITALRDAAGNLRGFGKVTRDVTERREREWAQANAQLIVQQRHFLKEILASVTQGKLLLCDSAAELPAPLKSEPDADPLPLTPTLLRVIRTVAGQAAMACHFSKDRTHDLLSGVAEATMNAVVHAGGGTARVYSDPEAGTVQVWVEDQGKGIDLTALPRATLERGFSSVGTLGHGFWLILQTCDRVYLLTGNSGTTIVLEQHRDVPSPAWARDL